MATASGQVTNAVFGFTSMLINLLRDHQPDGIVVAFDRPEPTFRHERRRRLQGQPRPRRPTSCASRWASCARWSRRCASRSSTWPGSRPTTSSPRSPRRPSDRGDEVIIVTGDRDSYQLVEDPYVKVLYNRRGVSDYALYDEAGIEERTGVHAGASTRSTPRCGATRPTTSPACPASARRPRPSSSPPTAASTASSTTSTSRRRSCAANLAEHEAQVRQQRRVMVLLRDVPLDVDLDELLVGDRPTSTRCKRLFDFLEFRTLYDRLAEALGDAHRRGHADRRRRCSKPRSPVSTRRGRRRLPTLAAPDRARRRGGVGRGSRAAARSIGLAVVARRRRRPTVVWIPARLLADPRCARRGRCVASAGRSRAHSAKPLMRGRSAALGVDLRTLALDTAHRRLPARPGRVPLRARRPAGAVHGDSSCPTERRGRDGPARLRRRRRRRSPSSPAADARWPSAASRRRSTRRSTRRACARSTTTIEIPLVARAGPHGGRRRRRRRRRAAAA